MVKQLKRNINWVYEKTILKCCVSSGLFIYHTKNSDFQKDIGTKQDKNHCFHFYRCLPLPFPRIKTHIQIQECFLFTWYRGLNKKFICPELTKALSGTDGDFSRLKNIIKSLVKIVLEMSLDILGVNSHITTGLGIKINV